MVNIKRVKVGDFYYIKHNGWKIEVVALNIDIPEGESKYITTIDRHGRASYWNELECNRMLKTVEVYESRQRAYNLINAEKDLVILQSVIKLLEESEAKEISEDE